MGSVPQEVSKVRGLRSDSIVGSCRDKKHVSFVCVFELLSAKMCAGMSWELVLETDKLSWGVLDLSLKSWNLSWGILDLSLVVLKQSWGGQA
jgi:hypothetical protein